MGRQKNIAIPGLEAVRRKLYPCFWHLFLSTSPLALIFFSVHQIAVSVRKTLLTDIKLLSPIFLSKPLPTDVPISPKTAEHHGLTSLNSNARRFLCPNAQWQLLSVWHFAKYVRCFAVFNSHKHPGRKIPLLFPNRRKLSWERLNDTPKAMWIWSRRVRISLPLELIPLTLITTVPWTIQQLGKLCKVANPCLALVY